MKKAGDRALRSLAPTPAIKLGGRDRSDSARSVLWLAIFMRCVAVLWIAEGLVQWTNVLTDDSAGLVGTASAPHVTALFFFCVLDLVAAVGLWLLAPWGGAVWITTMFGHVLAVIFAPGFLAEPVLMLFSDTLLVAVYAALNWFASRGAGER